jgi:hypothetical protein
MRVSVDNHGQEHQVGITIWQSQARVPCARQRQPPVPARAVFRSKIWTVDSPASIVFIV